MTSVKLLWLLCQFYGREIEAKRNLVLICEALNYPVLNYQKAPSASSWHWPALPFSCSRGFLLLFMCLKPDINESIHVYVLLWEFIPWVLDQDTEVANHAMS